MPPVIVGVAAYAGATAASYAVATAVAIGIGAAVATYAVTEAMTPEMGSMDDGLGSDQSLTVGGVKPRRTIYGETVVSGGIVGYGTYTDDEEDKWHVMTIAIADHECESIDLHDIEGKGLNVSGLNSRYKINSYLGTQTTACPIAKRHCDGWTSEHVGFGLSYVTLEVKIDPEFFPNGINNVRFKVKGKKLYDARLDSTMGGSGSHRFNDATTWEYSANPILATIDFIRFGGYKEQPSERFDWSDVSAQASACDEVVSFTDSNGQPASEPRFTCNGTLLKSQTPAASLNRLLSSAAAKMYNVAGKIYVKAGVYQGAPTLVLDKNNASAAISYKPHTPIKDRCNTVRTSFVNPKKYYQKTDATPTENAIYKNADGMTLEHSVELHMTNSETMCQRIGKNQLEQNRSGFSLRFPLFAIGLLIMPGQAVSINLPDDGINNEEFKCVDWAWDSKKRTAVLTFGKDSDSLYSDDFEPNEAALIGNSFIDHFEMAQFENNAITWINATGLRTDQGQLSWTYNENQSAIRYDVELRTLNAHYISVDDPRLDPNDPTYAPNLSTTEKYNYFFKQSTAEKSIKINGVPVGTYQVVVAAINRLNSRVFQVRTITFTKESATILDEAGWEEIPESGADVTDYEGIANDIANATNNLGKSNFTSEVTALLEQVESIPTEETLPVLLDGIVEDIKAQELALNNVKLDETNIAALQATYQQLGMDLLSSQGDTNSAFNAMVEKLSDTDQFVFDINEQLGALLVEGGKVSYEQFTNYKLLVDTLNGSLTSIINQVTNSNSGLSAAHSKIDQNINDISLLLGNTDITDLLTKTTQVSVNLDRLSNTLTEQSFAAQFDDWATFQQTLSNDFQLTDLLERNIDLALVQEKITSEVSEVQAEASSTKKLVAAFEQSLSSLATNENVLSTAKETKATFTRALNSKISDEASTRESAILSIEQTVVNESETTATALSSLNSAIEDETTARNSAIDTVNQTITNEKQTTATALSNLNSAIEDETTARNSAIDTVNQTITNEKQTMATALSSLNSAIADETTARNSAIDTINQTITDEKQTTATAITNLNSSIEDEATTRNSEITATNQTVATKASTTALSNLAARVATEENKSAAAILTMNAQSDDIGDLEAQVFLGVNINGKVTGIYMSGDTSQSIIDIMGDKIQFTNPITNNVDFRWSAAQRSFAFQGSINLIGATHMRLSSANAFGSSNQFIEWFGPKLLNGSGDPDFTKIKESNAISFLKADGSAYFGGAIVSGTLNNSLATSSLSTTALVDLGSFGSNGGSIAIACSVTLSSQYNYFSATAPTAPPVPYCSIRLEEYVGGSWVARQTMSYTGTGTISGSEYERESKKWRAVKHQNLGGSFTYTDNKKTTASRRYRLRMTSRSGLLTTSSYSPTQRLSITTSEG